jgi:hypothetical protein
MRVVFTREIWHITVATLSNAKEKSNKKLG